MLFFGFWSFFGIKRLKHRIFGNRNDIKLEIRDGWNDSKKMSERKIFTKPIWERNFDRTVKQTMSNRSISVTC